MKYGGLTKVTSVHILRTRMRIHSDLNKNDKNVRKDQYHKKQKTEKETKGKNIFSIQKQRRKNIRWKTKSRVKLTYLTFNAFLTHFNHL